MKTSASAFHLQGKGPRNRIYGRGIESRLLLPAHVLEFQNWSEIRKTLVRKYIYHRSRESDDGVTVGARDTTGSETSAVIGQVAAIGGSQASKDGEGENILHVEGI